MSDERQPWDRLEGEPEPAYKRFLIYRNLGPARTVVRAIEVAEIALPKEPEKAQKGTKRRANKKTSRPGSWAHESAQWDWKARANSYDIFVLTQAGKLTASAMSESLASFHRKIVELLENDKIRDALDIWAAVSTYASPQDIIALADSGTKPEPRIYQPAAGAGTAGQ